MNKTVSIHIQGFAFILEEQAYDQLRTYLNDLARVLQHEEGKEEILQDIELRIVELLQEKVTNQQVVQLEQVQQIIQLLGSPEAFGQEEPTTTGQTSAENPEPMAAQKRFFRDPENPILGGVAGGVAAYFNIDVVFVRIFFVLFTMAFGSGIPIYIILWIVTPRALTASDKLQMRGRAVNVESIKTEFKEATERIEKNANKWTQQFRTGSGMSERTNRFVNFIKKVLGSLMVLWGLAVLITLSVFIFIDPKLIPAQINGEFTSLGELSALFFETSQLSQFIYLGVALIGYAVALSSILTGMRLLFTFEAKWLRGGYLAFSIAAVCGVILLIFVGVSTGKSFAIEGELSKEIGTYSGDSLRLDISTDLHLEGAANLNVNAYHQGYRPSKNPDQGIILAHHGRIFISGIAVNYIASTDSLFHVKILKRANGASYYKANLRAAHIDFPCKLATDQLSLASGFSFPAKDRMRDQEVELQIAVPTGKCVVWNGQVVFPYTSFETPNSVSDRAYVYGDGEYSAW
jgi:phage shock protein PspC (stress-responsive transcriptional regulator)